MTTPAYTSAATAASTSAAFLTATPYSARGPVRPGFGQASGLDGEALTIETERLILRPPRIADLGPLHEVWGDRDLMRWIGTGDAYSRDVEESAWRLERIVDHQEEHGFSLWTVVERDSGTVLGDCGLVRFAFRGPEIELVCRLRKGVWGQGFATEAGAAWLDHAFGELGLERVVAAAHPENEASHRVLEKLGMHRDRTTRLDGVEVLLYAAERRERERER